MAEKGFKRKLTAILSADAVGYSRLMGDDEEATVRTITAYREVLTTLIQRHNGQVLDSPGDNLLAEFVSVVDAVQCAVAVQKEINARNTELPENRKMQFRIGINLGDVIQEEKRIYGDGVNIAARLEGLADPGGICISKTAFDQIESKLPYGYEFLGDQTVKNIAKPVGAYRVLMDTRVTVSGKPIYKKSAFKRRMPIFLGAAAILVIAVAVGILQFYMRRPKVEPASVEKMAYPLPDKPSIVVLPFDNLSKDPDEEYLIDAITDQIIIGLSKIPYMFVIAKESSFSYKGKAVEVRRVSEELGVQYVLEGSAQRSGDRIRIAAQLIDAITGHHLWSERYDRGLKDIFELQDDIMINVMQAMQMKVAGLSILENRPPPPSIEAHIKILKAIKHVYHWTKEDNALGRKLYEEAIELNPEYASTYRLLGWTYLHDVDYGWSGSPGESLEKAEKLANTALSLGDDGVYHLLSSIYSKKGQWDLAVDIGEKGLAINSNWANYNAVFAHVLTAVGKNEAAIVLIKKAMRLNPHYPPWYLAILGLTYNNLERYNEAIPLFKKYIELSPNDFWGHLRLIEGLIQLNRLKEAREAAAEVFRITPNLSLEFVSKLLPSPYQVQKETFLEALRKAGIPE